MNIQQLELPLWSQLQSARLVPEAVDLVAVLDQAESAISQLPKSQQMQAAGEAILQLAQLCSLRSEVLIENWENAYRDPHVAHSFFSDIVRQTMAVDLSDLIEPAPPRAHRRSKSNSKADSVAAPVDKSALLAMVEKLEAKSPASELPLSDEQKKQLALASAHDEDISAWQRAISHWLRARVSTEPVFLLQLQQQLGMPLVEVWLGVLHTQEPCYLKQCGDFYDPHSIQVSLLEDGDH